MLIPKVCLHTTSMYVHYKFMSVFYFISVSTGRQVSVSLVHIPAPNFQRKPHMLKNMTYVKRQLV
jgi:hypothetical protein